MAVGEGPGAGAGEACAGPPAGTLRRLVCGARGGSWGLPCVHGCPGDWDVAGCQTRSLAGLPGDPARRQPAAPRTPPAPWPWRFCARIASRGASGHLRVASAHVPTSRLTCNLRPPTDRAFSRPREGRRKLFPFCFDIPRTLVARALLTVIALGGLEECQGGVANRLGKTSELSFAVWGLYA